MTTDKVNYKMASSLQRQQERRKRHDNLEKKSKQCREIILTASNSNKVSIYIYVYIHT